MTPPAPRGSARLSRPLSGRALILPLLAALMLVSDLPAQVGMHVGTNLQGVTPKRGRVRMRPKPKRPNIVVIMADDMGWADMGVQGSAFIKTPVLNALAAGGARLSNHCASAASCSPTRVSQLTGVSPSSLGFLAPINMDTRRGIPSDVFTLPEGLNKAGYTTGFVGKWHIGEDHGPDSAEFLPPGVGFDWSARLVFPPVQSQWDPTVSINEQTQVQTTGHTTDVITDYALDFIDDHAQDDQPFFLNMWYFAPHLPAEAPQEYIDMYPGADPDATWTKYSAMVTHMDAAIGDVMYRLDAHGLLENTLVVFTSDNGGALNPGLHPSGNGPFKGGKGDVFEGGLRVPFIGFWPGVIPSGVVNDSLTVTTDIVPTAFALAGIKNSSPEWQGENLYSALTRNQRVARPEMLFWAHNASPMPLKPASGILQKFAVRQDETYVGGPDWKLVFLKDQIALFDITTDIGETIDLKGQYPGKLQELWDAYWTQHRPQAFFSWSEGGSHGSVAPVGAGGFPGSGYAFSGGAVALAKDARYDVHDGFFTAQMTVRADAVGRQTLLHKQDSFELYLDDNNVLQLMVQGQDGSSEQLSDSQALLPGQSYDVAFTLQRWASPLSENGLTLYVDAVAVDTGSIVAVQANRNTLWLGSDDQPALATSPLAGVITDLRFSVSALTPEELVGSWPAIP